MPDAADPMASLGYLVAAVAVTVAGLGGYALSLAQRLRGARARYRELRAAKGAAETRSW
jgi:hypothetical protein